MAERLVEQREIVLDAKRLRDAWGHRRRGSTPTRPQRGLRRRGSRGLHHPGLGRPPRPATPEPARAHAARRIRPRDRPRWPFTPRLPTRASSASPFTSDGRGLDPDRRPWPGRGCLGDPEECAVRSPASACARAGRPGQVAQGRARSSASRLAGEAYLRLSSRRSPDQLTVATAAPPEDCSSSSSSSSDSGRSVSHGTYNLPAHGPEGLEAWPASQG